MRHLAVPIAALLLTACPASTYFNPPPASRFYFPTGVAHADLPGSPNGVLFVANSNWNKLYATGSIGMVYLDQVGLPVFGAAPANGPLDLTDLGDAGTIQVNSFTGPLATLQLSPSRLRLFVASRSEGMKFQAVDATFADGGVALSCFPAAPPGAPTDCATNAPSTSPAAFEQAPGGVPRAVAPYGVAVQPRVCTSASDCGADAGRSCSGGACFTATGEAFADTWITHLIQVDSPIGSGLNYRSYVVRVESDTMALTADDFFDLGLGSTSGVTAGRQWVYVSGRLVGSGYPFANLVRFASYRPSGNFAPAPSALELLFRAQDARGIAVGSGERKLYILSRSPDALVVAALSNIGDETTPTLRLLEAVPLPNGPNELVVIPRPGQGDLVAVTCTGVGVLAVYDEDLGGLAAQVTSIGQQPFGLAVDRRGSGARIYVSTFNDGRIAVIDVPDLGRPQEARLVARLGKQQICLTNADDAACRGVTP
jgi:hypothetical protein